MRAEAVAAERAAEVRKAARSWHQAGVIERAVLDAIEARHPDDRRRAGPALRVLLFAFLGIVILAAVLGTGNLLHVRSREGATALFLAAATALVIATEVLTGGLRRAQGGLEAATGLLAVCFLVAAIAVATDLQGEELALAASTLACAAGAWRWGFAPLLGIAAVSGFALLGKGPVPRLLWILAALVATPLLVRATTSARLAPSHRRGAAWAAAVTLAALYTAVQIASLDHRAIEAAFGGRSARAAVLRSGEFARAVSIAATVVLPAAILALGMRRKSRLLLHAGVVLVAASLVTLRLYVHVAPLWVVLAGSGIALVLVVLALRRFLAAGPRGERGGFTADPLLEAGASRFTLEVATSVAMAHAAAASPPGPASKGLEGGGGRGGGAGATGDW